MKIKRLNTMTIKKLQPDIKRYDVQVEDKTGLVLRVNPDRTIAFTYRYQLEGRRRKISLGMYPDELSLEDANILYAKARKAVKNGIDPLTKRENEKLENESDPTIAELSARFLKYHCTPKLKPKTVKEYNRQFKKDILPKWGKRKAKEIKRLHVVALVEKKAERTPAQANRVLATIKGMFSYAVRVGILENSPAARVSPPGKERIKDRYLDMNEILLFSKIANEYLPLDFRDVLFLILLTAKRPGEIVSMRLDQIKKDQDGQWFELSGSETKNGKPHRTFLNEPARKIIENRVQTLPLSKYIFPAKNGSKIPFMHLTTLRTRIARIQPYMKESGVPWFTAHDLRRSAATHIARLGYGAVVPDILNHALQGVTRQIYDLYNRAPEIRQAMIAWGNAVQQAIDGPEVSNIISVDF